MSRKESENKSKSELVADFLVNKKTTLLAILIIAAVAVIGGGAAAYFTVSNKEKAFDAAAVVVESYIDYIQASDDDKEKAGTEFLAKADAVLTDYAGSLAEMTALIHKADYLFETEDYAGALELNTRVYTDFADTYNAPIAVFNAASAAENNGDADKALELLLMLEEKFSAKSKDMPEVLFTIGRLYEGKNQAEEAKVYYEKILNNEEFAKDNFANYAKTRLIALGL